MNLDLLKNRNVAKYATDERWIDICENIINVNHNELLIKKAINKQLQNGKYNKSKIYAKTGRKKRILR